MPNEQIWKCRRLLRQRERVAPRIVVAIPARNEAERVGDCLWSLAEQKDAFGNDCSSLFGVIVFLNGCTDDSVEIVDQIAPNLPYPLRIVEGDLKPGFSHAGGARRVVMDLAANWIEELGDGQGYILTTDADSRPSSTWITDTMAAFGKGVDAVAGRIELDHADEAALSESLRARGALEEKYETLLTEIFSLLDPRPHDPWPRHASEPGASLALSLAAYRTIGGLPVVEFGEDRALVVALENANLKLRHAPAVSVITSGRLIGRAHGGVADALAFRTENPQAECDPYLEPVAHAVRRAWWRGRLRLLRERGQLVETGAWAPQLKLDPSIASRIACQPFFGVLWGWIEMKSPRLQRVRVTPRDLPMQIGFAEFILMILRRTAGRGSRTHAKLAAAVLEEPTQTLSPEANT